MTSLLIHLSFVKASRHQARERHSPQLVLSHLWTPLTLSTVFLALSAPACLPRWLCCHLFPFRGSHPPGLRKVALLSFAVPLAVWLLLHIYISQSQSHVRPGCMPQMVTTHLLLLCQFSPRGFYNSVLNQYWVPPVQDAGIP